MNMEAIIIEIGLLKIEPGQVLVVSVREPWLEFKYRSLAEFLESRLPGMNILVLPAVDLSVIDPLAKEETA